MKKKGIEEEITLQEAYENFINQLSNIVSLAVKQGVPPVLLVGGLTHFGISLSTAMSEVHKATSQKKSGDGEFDLKNMPPINFEPS